MDEQPCPVRAQFHDSLIPEEIRQYRWENAHVQHAGTGNEIKGDPAATTDFPEIKRKNAHEADGDDCGEKTQRMEFCRTQPEAESMNRPADNRQEYPQISAVNPQGQ